MIRFNPRWGAAVLLALASVYLVLALMLRHSAASEKPADLSPSQPGLDPWKAAALVMQQPDSSLIVDVRAADRYALYHLPRSLSLPQASAGSIVQSSQGKTQLLLVTESEKDALELIPALQAAGKSAHYLNEGVRSWYLSFELPVPLFSDKPAPFGYLEAQAAVRSWLVSGTDRDGALRALDLLAKSNYGPSLLAGKKRAPAAGTSTKKITGGCGG